MQINGQRLIKSVLSIAAVSLLTACVDDKYDLTDIDTTSRFTVENLTVPVNLSNIKLENIINLDDNENISKIQLDGQECYAIVKDGDISTSEFSVKSINRVASPSFNTTSFKVSIPQGISVSGSQLDLDPIDLDCDENPLQDYEFNMQNIDGALEVLSSVKTELPIEIDVKLSIPSNLVGANNSYTFKNIQVRLPWGLITEIEGYDIETGLLKIRDLNVGNDGVAQIKIQATGLDLGDKGKVENGRLSITGQVGVEAAQIKISVSDVTLPPTLTVKADYSVSSFDVASFSGKINYKMDDINIEPISLSDLPDFLDSPDTELIIAKPQITLDIHNPAGKYGLNGKGVITLTSNFKGGYAVQYTSDVFSIEGNESKLAFCEEKDGYTTVKFDGLREILTSGKQDIGGLPQSISVNIQNLVFEGDVQDFPIGDNIGKANGSYDFTAPLGFGKGSKVIYETTEDGWGSDDLDKVNITKIHVKANCTTNLPVGVYLTLDPVDKYGNVIAVKEQSSLLIDPKCENAPISISLEGANGPIHGFDGIKFKAIVSQDANNTEALGPDLSIKLSDIRVTVDGYYETDF